MMLKLLAAALVAFVFQLLLIVFGVLFGPGMPRVGQIPDGAGFICMALYSLFFGACAVAASRFDWRAPSLRPDSIVRALKVRRLAVFRLGILLALAAALRGAAMDASRKTLYRTQIQQLTEVLTIQRDKPELFLGREISDEFVRKMSGLVVVSGPPPTIDTLRQHLYPGNIANCLSRSLDECDHHTERFLLQHPKQAADAIVERLSNIEGLTWARGGFVLDRLPEERESVLAQLRVRLTEQEASQYGQYRAMVLAATIARLDPSAPGTMRHLKAAAREHSFPLMQIMGTETLGRMGLRAWPAAPELIWATFALHPTAAATASRAIRRAWLLPALPFAALEAVQAMITPYGSAAILFIASVLLLAALGAWKEGEPLKAGAFLAELEPDQRTAKWVLFWALCCGVPTLGFYIVAAGLVPAIIYPLSMVLALVSGEFRDLGFIAIISGIHFLVYGAIFYLAALATSALIFRVDSRRVRLTLLFGTAGALAICALLPIYQPIAHNSPGGSRNLPGILRP